ncbi:MAG: tRNA pseudouridine(38-40) synthase TruA [Candidatus Thorarchaeota archaeon]
MSSYVCKLFYLGDNYHGSQWQSGPKTVQGELISALKEMTYNDYAPNNVLFSGRTDRGVHSLGQIVMFSTEKQLNIDKVNRYLPEDILLWASIQAPEKFVPRYDVLMRHYRYYLNTEKLDIDRVRLAAALLTGTNDFKLISKPDGNRGTSATILNIFVNQRDGVFILDVYGASFLWRLVRKMTTLLTKVGTGELAVQVVDDLLAGNAVIAGGIQPAAPECLILVDAVVPFRLKTSKNALSKVQKILKSRLSFYHRSSMVVNNLSKDFISGAMQPF